MDVIWDRLAGGSILHAWVRCAPSGFKGNYKTLCGKHQPMTHRYSVSGLKKCPKCQRALAAERGE